MLMKPHSSASFTESGVLFRARPLIVCLIAFGVSLAATPNVFAQVQQTSIINYPNFGSTAGLQLNGSALQIGNVLQLTPAEQVQTGSVWFNSPVNVANGFSTSFSYNICGGSIFGGKSSCPGANGSDGLTFTIQNSVAGPTAIGAAGG